MTDNLERLISAALKDDGVTSARVAELVAATEAGIEQADKDAETARTRALDPVLSPDPEAAKKAMDAAVFAFDRLKTLQPRLQKRLILVQHAEEKARWNKVYEQLIPERDALAKELTELYTRFVPKLVDVLTRAAKHDRAIARARQTRPTSYSGEAHDPRELNNVEAHARGFSHLESEHLFSLMQNLLLPDWGNPTRRAWPPYPNEQKPDPEEQRLDAEAWQISQQTIGLAQTYLYELQRQQTKPKTDSRPMTEGERLAAHYQNLAREKQYEFDRSKQQ